MRGLHVSLVFLLASVCCDTAQTKAESVPVVYFILFFTCLDSVSHFRDGTLVEINVYVDECLTYYRQRESSKKIPSLNRILTVRPRLIAGLTTERSSGSSSGSSSPAPAAPPSASTRRKPSSARWRNTACATRTRLWARKAELGRE